MGALPLPTEGSRRAHALIRPPTALDPPALFEQFDSSTGVVCFWGIFHHHRAMLSSLLAGLRLDVTT